MMLWAGLVRSWASWMGSSALTTRSLHEEQGVSRVESRGAGLTGELWHLHIATAVSWGEETLESVPVGEGELSGSREPS